MTSHPAPDPEPDEAPSAEFAEALEAFERGARPAAAAARASADVSVGTKVRAKVVAVGPEHTLLDFGGRSEAVAETRHFRAEDGTPRVAAGDTLELFVIEAGDQVVLAPSIRADPHAARRQMREAQAAGVPVTGRVTGLNAGGLEVDLGGVHGFCPLSQIEDGFCADPKPYVGRTLEFLVTRVEEGRGGAVLSRRELLRRAAQEKAKQLLASLKPGDELDGTVTRVAPFGAFVDLGGIEGLVHVSELRHERIADPGAVLRAGEAVRVRVLRIEPPKEREPRPRIALSIKASLPDPWTGIEARFAPGARVEGVVARLTDFGAFVTLAPGVDGLVHVSQAARGRIGHVREVLAPGDRVEAIVLSADPTKKRIALSIRDALEPAAPPPRDERAAAPAPRDERAAAPTDAPAHAPAATAPDSKAGAESPASPPPPAPPAELTTMAIALRKAMEESRNRTR